MLVDSRFDGGFAVARKQHLIALRFECVGQQIPVFRHIVHNQDSRDDRLDMALVGDSFADQAQASFLAHARSAHQTAEVSAYGGIGVCDRVDQLADIAAGRLRLRPPIDRG